MHDNDSSNPQSGQTCPRLGLMAAAAALLLAVVALGVLIWLALAFHVRAEIQDRELAKLSHQTATLGTQNRHMAKDVEKEMASLREKLEGDFEAKREAALREAEKEHIRRRVQALADLAAETVEQAARRGMDKDKALELLRALSHWGDAEERYFWVQARVDGGVRVLMHPFAKHLIGRPLDDFTIPAGTRGARVFRKGRLVPAEGEAAEDAKPVFLFKRLNDECLARGQAAVRYYSGLMGKPPDALYPKIACARRVEPWNWVVVSSAPLVTPRAEEDEQPPEPKPRPAPRPRPVPRKPVPPKPPGKNHEDEPIF